MLRLSEAIWKLPMLHLSEAILKLPRLRLAEAMWKLQMLLLSEAIWISANSEIRLDKLPVTNLLGWLVLASERPNICSF
jgi:hypothetical protein